MVSVVYSTYSTPRIILMKQPRGEEMNLRLKCYFLAVHVYKKKVHIWFKRD